MGLWIVCSNLGGIQFLILLSLVTKEFQRLEQTVGPGIRGRESYNLNFYPKHLKFKGGGMDDQEFQASLNYISKHKNTHKTFKNE